MTDTGTSTAASDEQVPAGAMSDEEEHETNSAAQQDQPAEGGEDAVDE